MTFLMMQCIRMNNWKYTYKLNHSSIIAIYLKSQYYHIARLNQVHIIILQFHNIYIINIRLNILIFSYIIFYIYIILKSIVM